MADLPRLDEAGQGGQGFPQRHSLALLLRLEVGLAEHGHVAIRPVQLVEVDIIRLQARERAVERQLQIAPAETELPGPDPVQRPPGTGRLGRQDDAVAGLALQPGAHVALGQPRRLGPRRDRVHLGGIDEVDALAQGMVQLGMRFGLAVLLAEGHGPQADRRDGQVAVSGHSRFHRDEWASSFGPMHR